MAKRQHANQTPPSQAAARLAQLQQQQPSTLAYKARSTPRTQPPPLPPRRVVNILLRYRKVPLFLAGATAACIPLYCTFIYLGYKRDAERASAKGVPLDVSDRYNHTAPDYDESVDTMEWLMGIGTLRRKMAQKARGHVLESAAGTGRNMQYYPLTKGIKSMTLVDASNEMLTVARIKWAKTNAYFTNAVFRCQDAAVRVPCPSPDGFDTIVQTMGVCSTPEPERVLRNLGEMVNPDGGRILLLEHGKGYYEWLNGYLDTMAPAHADRHGCWYNKDVGEIVRKSGLEVVEAKRYHFGTTWWFVLKPKPRPVVVEKVKDVLGEKTTDGVESAKKGAWWWS